MATAALIDTVQTTALVIGVLAGSAAGIGVLINSPFVGRPLKWLWRRLIAEPVGESLSRWFDRQLTHRNGGSSLMDKIDNIDGKLDRHISSTTERLDRIEVGLANGGRRFDAIEEALTEPRD